VISIYAPHRTIVSQLQNPQLHNHNHNRNRNPSVKSTTPQSHNLTTSLPLPLPPPRNRTEKDSFLRQLRSLEENSGEIHISRVEKAVMLTVSFRWSRDTRKYSVIEEILSYRRTTELQRVCAVIEGLRSYRGSAQLCSHSGSHDTRKYFITD